MTRRTITDEEIGLLKAMVARGMKNRGIQFFFNRPDRADDADMAAADGPSALPFLHFASTTYRIATGLHAGHQIAKIGGGFCVAGRGGGFRLNAATRCRAGNRHRLAPQ